MEPARAGGSERSFPRRVESLEAIFEYLMDFFEAEHLAEDDRFAVELIVDELFTNALRHQPRGGAEVRLGLERREDTVVIRLTDLGVDPFDIRTVPDPVVDLPLEQRRPGGLGIHLIRCYADRIEYEFAEGRSTTTLTRKIGGRA